jgi:hypothetical protein
MVIKIRWMRWVEELAHMDKNRTAYKALIGKPNLKQRDHQEDTGIDGKIIEGNSQFEVFFWEQWI